MDKVLRICKKDFLAMKKYTKIEDYPTDIPGVEGGVGLKCVNTCAYAKFYYIFAENCGINSYLFKRDANLLGIMLLWRRIGLT